MIPELRSHFSEPLNQDSIGWCYGFVASDLISAEIRKPVSAFHTSAIYNEKVENSFFPRIRYKVSNFFKYGLDDNVYEGGWVKEAIESVNQNRKVCLEKDLSFDINHYASTQTMILELEKLKVIVEKSACKGSCMSLHNFISKHSLNNLLPNELYAILLSNNINIALNKIIEEHCGRRQVQVPHFKIYTLRKPRLRISKNPTSLDSSDLNNRIKSYFSKINSHFDTGKPLGIEYDISHVTQSDGMHASVLVGRRWNNGRCEYKIRNTWGKSCDNYHRRKISECNKQEGSFWVTDQKLHEMANNIIYIKR